MSNSTPPAENDSALLRIECGNTTYGPQCASGIVNAEPTRPGRRATLLTCSRTLSSIVISNGWLPNRMTDRLSWPDSDLKLQL
jgi:hypothetical protein